VPVRNGPIPPLEPESEPGLKAQRQGRGKDSTEVSIFLTGQEFYPYGGEHFRVSVTQT